MSSRASDIDAGLPPAQAVKKWSRSTHTNVLFSPPWTTQKKMLMMMIMVRKNPSLHPSLSMPTLRLCSRRTDNLKPTCCVTGPAKARRSLPTRERTVSAPFLHDLDDATEIPDDDRERTVIVIFHNLKGFDGMFIIDELYKQQRGIENQLTVGSKVLSFQSASITSKDSLCFLPMPLASFPSPIDLTELKKGFFPHEFNSPHHQNYVGSIPGVEFFDPDGMSEKKKKELEEWHADQVRRGVQYDFAW